MAKFEFDFTGLSLFEFAIQRPPLPGHALQLHLSRIVTIFNVLTYGRTALKLVVRAVASTYIRDLLFIDMKKSNLLCLEHFEPSS